MVLYRAVSTYTCMMLYYVRYDAMHQHREQMISGGAAERGDREDEAERDKRNGTQPAPDKMKKAPSGALSPELASDKGEEAPVSLIETRSPSNDKDAPSQREHTNSLEVMTMHPRPVSTLISLEADKLDSTLPPLDERAQDNVVEIK
jgi:hypothetical protein